MPTVSQNPRRRNGEAKERAAKLRAQITGSLDVLAQAVDDVRASETFRAFLDVQAKFHRYTWHNTMLILSQRPEASQVAGFKKWKELGRFVRKGEHGIAIFAPMRFKRTVERGDGSEEEREGLSFRIVHVFDVAQTDGEPLPDVDVPDVQTAADTLLASLERVAHQRGIAVRFVDAITGGAYGVSKGGAVEIDRTHTTGQQAKTLAHELAHEVLHKGKENRKGLTRAVAELEAESVAYVVSRHCGLDVEVRASRYIALWGGDSDGLRASLERIADTARGIIDDLEALDARKAVA